MSFLRRRLIIAALTANAVRPLPGYRGGVSSFFPGWLVGELAPHLLAATAVDTAVHLARGRSSTPGPSTTGVALAGASSIGLLHLIRQSRHVQQEVEAAIAEGIGADYVDRLDAPPTPADLATPWRRLVYPFRMRDVAVRVDRDLPYTDAGRRGVLDVYRPADRELDRAPVLLQVHGGGWTIGTKDQQGLPLMQHMAAKGWVCVAPNYRLAPRDPFPAQVVDVKKAIAWVKEHIEEYGGDPDYVVITGGSAGGHLTALAALTANDPEYQPGFEDADTTVQAAVPHYGVYDWTGATGVRGVELMRDGYLAPRIVQQQWSDAPEVFEAASPIERITEDAPDFFVLHGVFDTLVSVQQARLFVERLRERSRKTVVYAELRGAQHAFDVFPSIRSAHVVRAIDRYLHWHWNSWREAQARNPAVTRRTAP